MSPKSVTKLQRTAPSTFHARHGALFIMLLLIFAPLIGWGYIKAEQSNNNNIKQWLPDGLPETEQYETFRRHFGSDEFAIISWDGCTLDDRLENSQLELFARVMERSTIDAAVAAPSVFESLGHRLDTMLTGVKTDRSPSKLRLIREVITGPRAIKALQNAPFVPKLSTEQILKRLEGIVIGRDHQTTCALLRLTSVGNEDRVATTNAILEATERLGFERAEVHIGGDAVFNAMIDIESRKAIHQLVLFAAIVAVVMALLALRSLKLTLMVLVTSVYAAATAQALVYFAGEQFNLVMVVMPVLIYVLTISACVHMVNYYRDANEEHGIRSATYFALRTGWTPCVLAAITTAVGLLSLTVSHVIPVRRFGQFGAIGVIASLIFIFVLLPVLFERYPIKDANDDDARSKKKARPQDLLWLKVCAKLMSVRVRMFAACLILIATAGFGITRVDTSVHTSRFFSEKHLLMRDIAWMEQHIGPMVTAEIVVTFDDNVNKMPFLDRMHLIERIENKVGAIEDVGGTLSGATWAPDLSSMQGDDSAFAKMLPLKRAFLISGLKDIVAKQRYFAPPATDDAKPVELWRITARVGTVGRTSYREIMNQMQKEADALVASLGEGIGAGITCTITGAVPLVHAAQQELLTGLFHSFLTAFALIGIVMMVLLRSVSAGLLSMLPNVFPATMIFGGMGWLGFPVDVGAMLTASVAMGIAVDGTLHYLTWFRRAMRSGKGRFAAITVAYQRCAAAITQTTLIAGLGLLVFFFASFQPVSQFGLLMCLLLVAAWIGDLVLLPTLLASPLGKVFEPKATKRDRKKNKSAASD